MKARIQFNGTEYASIDEMPPDVRRRYDLVMRNLRPLMDGTDPNDTTHSIDLVNDPGVQATVRTRIVVNDHAYGSPDEMPPDLRRQYEEAMRNMGTGAATSGNRVNLSVVRGRGSAHPESRGPIPTPGLGSPDPDPGTIRVEFTGRALLTVASIFAIGVAAWLLFGSGLFGPR